MADAFQKSPASTLRLLNGWEYVPQAGYNIAPNIKGFLQGERPNWALIAQHSHFSRDIEDPMLSSLLDYATATSDRTTTFALLAPAGFGVTTALMSLAVSLVQEKAGPVFMLRAGSYVTEGDIEFACTISNGRPFFVIDNASDYARNLDGIMQHVKRSRKAACFILGDRRNEWRALGKQPKAKEFAIESLSEPEIVRLLECLAKHGALGILADLSDDLRRTAIRDKHGRQLLVAMREATEGRAFDAIIEDEYRHLPDDVCRQLYATVSAVYKLRHHVRDCVVSEILKMPLPDLYRQTAQATDGVVEFDLIDDATGAYGARCRHHVIAEIVWERCTTAYDKTSIMLSLISALNLNYVVDSRLFDELIRSDAQVDSLAGLEAKIKFFENACQKDPNSPFVRQHYARMLLREKQLEVALSQIDAAIGMAGQERILHHTRGIVLREMCSAALSVEIARRRLSQSEACFRDNIRRDKRDSYSYQSLAELYLIWARRIVDDAEKADYLAKCEEVIKEGLFFAYQKEGLWIVSSQVQELLGNSPKSVEALVRAGSSPVAKYLLGRAYFRAGQYDLAIRVLEESLKADPADFRVAVLCARAHVSSGEGYGKGVAILRLANLYGMRSCQYIAVLGGMLFLNGEFTKAEEVFSESQKRRFPIEEEQRVNYRASILGRPEDRLRVEGEVVKVNSGYGWIRTPGYPDVFCPASRLRGRIWKPSDRVSFALCFNARGAIADDVIAL